ncbi:MAG TPA: hypothetical protein VGB64_09770 [Actinomycetota bacterium]
MTGAPIAETCVVAMRELRDPIGVSIYREGVPEYPQPTGADGAWRIDDIPYGTWIVSAFPCDVSDKRYPTQYYEQASHRQNALRFVIGPAGTYIVPREDPENPVSWNPFAAMTYLRAGPLDILLHRRTGIVGRVTNIDGDPLADICVTYFWSQAIHAGNTDLNLQPRERNGVRTGVDGTYVLLGPDDDTPDGSLIKIGFYPCDPQHASDVSSPWRGQYWYRAPAFDSGRTIRFTQGRWLTSIDAVLEPR